MAQSYETLEIRPYQAMCIVCRLAAGERDAGGGRLGEILRAVREKPYRPVTLRAQVSSVYAFQNPGRAEDTPEGELYNTKRDLDLLQRLGLTPGTVMPAIDLFDLLLRLVPSAQGICGYGEVTSEAWRGCPRAESGDYERGREKGLSFVIPGRTTEEMARAKEESARAIYEAEHLYIRPHHVMCMTCFYGGHLDNLAPIEEDNLYEAIVAIQRRPEIPITLIAGPCMICPPCHMYDPETNWCYLSVGIGLRDEKKDLDVLQRLGLSYGDTLPAREYLKLLYERIPSTRLICAYGDGIQRAYSWRVCDDPEGSERYRKGREAGLGVTRDA
ncbi:MAG: hypothetical protein HPY83_09705 [Anaerolineae bacterium]|nr:hypothetical protein [Anaerolineae bacterium]